MQYFLISNMYPDLNSPGYGSFVKNVVEGLASKGMNCKYSALIVGRPSSFIDKCIKYLKFYFCILFYYFRRYDFIYVHFPNHALPCLLPLYFIKKKKVILNLHGEDLLYNENSFSCVLGKMNDFFLKKVDAIVVPSKYFAEIVRERINYIDKKIIVSPSGGINKEYFSSKTFSNTETQCLHLGYVGRIDYNKGWKEAFEAFRLLPKSLNWKLTIIGYGAEIDTLQKLMSENSNLNIEYISKVEQKLLKKYYSKFDLLLFPSCRKEESLGLVGIEAMACGTPIIGTNIGGIPSYLIHKYNGFLVAPGSIMQIVEAIMEYKFLSLAQKQVYYQNCIVSSKKYFSENVISDLHNELESIGKL